MKDSSRLFLYAEDLFLPRRVRKDQSCSFFGRRRWSPHPSLPSLFFRSFFLCDTVLLFPCEFLRARICRARRLVFLPPCVRTARKAIFFHGGNSPSSHGRTAGDLPFGPFDEKHGFFFSSPRCSPRGVQEIIVSFPRLRGFLLFFFLR